MTLARLEPPFLWGAQYYRAPTPARECWARDLGHMRELGFNHVKFWVQWRWSERRPGEFYFDDLDELMELARRNELAVTLNTIFDVAPAWLYREYPDSRMILADGRTVEPCAVAHRQIGGHPGPCYHHPEALEFRKRFLEATLNHFDAHPALAMWDVWNEPELCFPQRFPVVTERLACYCPNCRQAFIAWLRGRYHDLDALNRVWGRCYCDWEEVELPYFAWPIKDFIDWREFFLDTITGEARWRLALAHRLSPRHLSYLHVVPNDLGVWNPVSCASDDFALARDCDVFASTMTGGPLMAPLVLSAAPGKVCYNVESHVNGGDTSLHQRRLGVQEVRRELLPQLAMGIRGFLFWQFRPEVLGREAPAWGLVEPDGGERSVTAGIREFSEKIMPYSGELMRLGPGPCEVGIWKSRRNEIFHYSIDQMTLLGRSYVHYSDRLYAGNFSYRFIDSEMLKERRLDGIRLLILPGPYYLDAAEAAALAEWIGGGGVAISEAHLAGYSPDDGRHAAVIPGAGLAEQWGFREVESCAAIHLEQREEAFPGAGAGEAMAIVNDDVRKALKDNHFSSPLLPLDTPAGGRIAGFCRYAEITGDYDEELGRFPGAAAPAAVRKKIGRGVLYYFATLPGAAERSLWEGYGAVIERAAAEAEIVKFAAPKLLAGEARVDRIGEDFVFLRQLGDVPAELEATLPEGEWKGLCSGRLLPGGRSLIRLECGETEIFRRS